MSKYALGGLIKSVDFPTLGCPTIATGIPFFITLPIAKANIIKTLKFSHTDKAMFDNNMNTHYHFLDEETRFNAWTMFLQRAHKP